MKNTLFAGSLIAASLTGSACGGVEDRVVREHSFDLADIRELEIRGNVGTIEIRPLELNELRVELEIEGEDGGWFSRGKDVSGLDLEYQVREGRLYLEQTERDTRTKWYIEMPSMEILVVDLNVGEIFAEVSAMDLAVDLGVGEATVIAPAAGIGDVRLSVGVGEATLDGGGVTEDRRRVVSQTIRGAGEGDKPVSVKVGVGEARVRLQ